jgi:hypothetical protein
MLANAAGPTPLARDSIRSFKFLRSIPCDVPLGSHASMFNMAAKYARLGKGVNPFIDRKAILRSSTRGNGCSTRDLTSGRRLANRFEKRSGRAIIAIPRGDSG